MEDTPIPGSGPTSLVTVGQMRTGRGSVGLVVFAAMGRRQAMYVERRAGVCGGVPIVSGSRTPVWMLAEVYVRSRGNVNVVCRRFPQRSRAEVLAALLYFEENRREIAAQIRAAMRERRRAAAATAAWRKRRRARRAA